MIALKKVAAAGIDLEKRLTDFHTDLINGVPEHEARGVKSLEASAWVNAADTLIKKSPGISKDQIDRWIAISDEESSTGYDGLNQRSYVARYIYFFRRKVGLVQELGLSINEPAYPQQTLNIGAMYMNDVYNVGQAGAVGPSSMNLTSQQAWNQIKGNINEAQLTNDLVNLRKDLLKDAADDPEKSVAVGEVAAAEIALKSGKGDEVLDHLKRAGKWAFDVLTKIGVSVASETVKKSFGL